MEAGPINVGDEAWLTFGGDDYDATRFVVTANASRVVYLGPTNDQQGRQFYLFEMLDPSLELDGAPASPSIVVAVHEAPGAAAVSGQGARFSVWQEDSQDWLPFGRGVLWRSQAEHDQISGAYRI